MSVYDLPHSPEQM